MAIDDAFISEDRATTYVTTWKNGKRGSSVKFSGF